MWVQALAAPLRARARHVDGMLLCHLLDSVLRVQENRSLANLLGFWCVFQLRAAAVGLSLHLGLAPLAECVKQSYRVVPVANIAFYPRLPSFTVDPFSHRTSKATRQSASYWARKVVP